LIDISNKHYALYRDTIIKFGGIPLTYSFYWKLKRNKTSVVTILQKSKIIGDHVSLYNKEFLNKIETPYYLSFDKIFSYTHKTLDALKKIGYIIYLVSYRSSKENAFKELISMNLESKFNNIEIGKISNNGIDTKIKFIRKLSKIKKRMIIVGDTEDDIIAAKSLDAISIGVLTGIRNVTQLQKLQPTFIVKNISSIPAISFESKTPASKINEDF
jgi:phosphoglycolate phosphatase-like HAD superfamily hydrolase